MLIMSEQINGLDKIWNCLDSLSNQNKAIISLLSGLNNVEQWVREEIVKGKRQDTRPGYLKGYNACDGTKTQSEIAEIIGVDVSTFSRVSDNWEELGLVYVVPTPNGKPAGKYYKKILPIQVRTSIQI
jgi:hypothetical protein